MLGRYLKVGEFGFFSLAILTVTFLSNLHRAFATQPLNVLGAAEEAPALARRMSVVLFAHALMVPAAIFLFTCVSLVFYPSTELAVAGATYLMVSLLQETVRRYWYTVERLDRVLRIDLVSYGLQCTVLFVAKRFIPLDAAIAFFLMACCAGSGLLVGLKGIDRVRLPSISDFRAVAGEHWKLSRWLLLTVLALWTSSQLYPFLIVKLGTVAVASFAVCRNLLSVMHVLVQSINNYLPSRVASLLKDDGERTFRRHAIRTLFQGALVSILFILAMQVAALPMLHLFYGGNYDFVESLLRTLSICVLPSVVGTVLGSYSLAMHDSRSTFFANLGGAIFTFTGGLWLINEYGVPGATAAVCLSLAIAALLQGCFLFVGIGRLTDASMKTRSTEAIGDL